MQLAFVFEGLLICVQLMLPEPLRKLIFIFHVWPLHGAVCEQRASRLFLEGQVSSSEQRCNPRNSVNHGMNRGQLRNRVNHSTRVALRMSGLEGPLLGSWKQSLSINPAVHVTIHKAIAVRLPPLRLFTVLHRCSTVHERNPFHSCYAFNTFQ